MSRSGTLLMPTPLSRTLKLVSSVGAVAAVIAFGGSALSQEGHGHDEVFTKTRTITITGPKSGNPLVSFDISWFDAGLDRYYLADRSNKSVDVVIPPSTVPSDQFQPGTGFVGLRGKTAAGAVCGPPTNTTTCIASNDISGPDGVLTLDNNGVKQLWVGDGNSRVWVLNPTTGAVLTLPNNAPNPIPTSANNPNRADELCFDSADKLVMVANNADDPPFASIISTETFTVVGKIVFDGTNGAPKSTNGAEQCQWSPRTGLFYINIPGVKNPDDGTGVTAVINPKIGTAPNVGKVVNVFPIPVDDCAAPQGMAVGPDKQILLGCNGPSPDGNFNTVVINENSGAVIKKLPNEGGNDEVWFNPGDGHYFGAGGQIPFPLQEQLNIIDSAGKRPDQIIPTGTNCNTTRRAHSVAADPNTNEVYLPVPPEIGTFSQTCTKAAPFFESGLCPEPATGQPEMGCVAVFAPVGKNDHPRTVQQQHTVQERHHDDHQQ